MGRTWRQYVSVLMKIMWYRRKRKPAVMLLEIVWPVTLFAMVIAVRQGSLPERRAQCFYRPRSMPSAGALQFLQSHVCTVNNMCLRQELYKHKGRQEGLGGSGVGHPPGQPAITLPGDSTQLLHIAPKVLHLVSQLKKTVEQPEIVPYISKGGLHLQNFIKNKTLLQENLKKEDINLPPHVFDALIAAEIRTAQETKSRRKRSTDSEGASDGQIAFVDLKQTLCEPWRLANIVHLPAAYANRIGQVSAELCKADHNSISRFVDLLTRELKTASLTQEVVSGVNSLVTYRPEDAVSDAAIITKTLGSLQMFEKLLKVLPIIGNAGDLMIYIKDIVVNARDTKGFEDVMRLVAPIVGSVINDKVFAQQLIDMSAALEDLIKFIKKATAGYSVQLIDIIPQRANLQVKLLSTGADRNKINRALHSSVNPAHLREMSVRQRLGYDWFSNETCISSQNPLNALFVDEEADDNKFLTKTICELRQAEPERDLLDFTGMTAKMDGIQRARTIGTLDYFQVIGSLTSLVTNSIEISAKVAFWIKNIKSLTSDIGKEIREALDIKFVLDNSVVYNTTQVLDMLYNIIVQSEEFKSLAASIHLARQIVESSENNFIEFKEVLKDPLAIGAILLRSDLTEELVDKVLGSKINLPGLLGLGGGQKGLTDTLCTGGSVLNLLGLTDQIGVKGSDLEDALCRGINIGNFIDIQKLLGQAVFKHLPNYMLYGDFWQRLLADFKIGVIDGIGSIMDLIKGDLKFQSAVLLKPLYYTVKDLGVSGRAKLSTGTPSLFDLIKDRVKEPAYFASDIQRLSNGVSKLSVFERKVTLAGNLREYTEHPSLVSDFLTEQADLSSFVTSLLLQSDIKYEMAYKIKDITFDGRKGKELCGPAMFRKFLKLPTVKDEDLRTLSNIICSLSTEKISRLVRTIVPQLNLKDLIQHMLDLSPTYLLQSANLTRAETKTFVKQIGPLGAQIGTFLAQVRGTDGGGHKSHSSAKSVLVSYGERFCGDPEAFNFGNYGASFLSAEEAEKEKDRLEAESLPPMMSRWTPIQLEEMKEFDDQDCVELYKSINGMAGIGPILWSFIKPLTRGKILFTPNNTATNAIMREAYWLFESVGQVEKVAQMWINFAKKKTASPQGMDTGPKGIGDLKEALTNPLVSSAIERTTGISGEELLQELGGADKLTEADFEQLTGLAKTIAKYIKCLDYGLEGYATERDMRKRAEILSKTDTMFAAVAFQHMEDDNHQGRNKRNVWDGFGDWNKGGVKKEMKLPKHIKYALMITIDHVVLPRGLFDKVKQAGPDDDFLDDLRYLWGFVVMQDLIEHAFINLQMKERNLVAELPRTSTQAFPYPCYDQDEFMVWSSFVVVIILLFSWLCMMAVGITTAVSEKETGIEDTMLVMGMKGSVNRLAWFTNTLLGMIFLSAFVTALIRGGKLVPHSEPMLIFLWLSTYSVSIVMLCYLVSALVHRTTLASLFGLLVYLILCIPFIILHSMGIVFYLNFNQKLLMSLSVTSAFCFGANELIVTEKNGLGITWDTAFKPAGDSFPFAWSCIMLCVDCVIYFLISWYISNKFPGKHGIHLPWYFPFSPYYWGCRKEQSNSFDPEYYRQRTSTNVQHVSGEEEPKDLPVGISVCGLSKIYNDGSNSCIGRVYQRLTGKSKLKAVNNLSVNFFKGQITAFLGHNGAGKSTCIHMLTGLIFPNEGTAFINGYNIKDGFDEIRKTLGFCPQHDVLFDYMTIKEHFNFYARIKGHGSLLDTQEEVDRMLDLTGLRKFKQIPVSQLSGGQRRRVSVGNAFIGGSEVIILDEPTSGVDPAARRLIWDIIAKHKRDRTIVLCTHHLDEADILGDRIVIMHQGKLICSGSSLWLKSHYGSGYQLTISKATEEPENRDTRSSCRRSKPGKWSTPAMMQFVRRYMPGAQVVEEIGTEVKIVLPTKRGQKPRFKELFDELEARKTELSIDKYGIADSTLEEVFLKVTRWTDEGRSLDPDYKSWADTGGNDNLAFDNDNPDLNLGRGDSGTGSFQLSTEDESSLGLHGSSSEELSSQGGESGTCSGDYDSSDTPRDSQYSSASDGELIGSEDGKLSGSRRIVGMALKWRQFKALLTKRFHHHRRDLKSHISQVVLPSLFVCLAMMATWFTPKPGMYRPFRIDGSMYGPDQQMVFSMFNSTPLAEGMMDTLRTYPGLGTLCMPVEPLNPYLWPWEQINCTGKEDYIAEFETPSVPSDQRALYRRFPNCSCDSGTWACPAEAAGLPRPTLVTHTGDRVVNLTGYPLGFEQYLLRTYNVFKNTEVGGTFGGWTFDCTGQQTEATVWYNNKGVHSLPAFYNSLNNMALRANIKMHTNESTADFGITLHNQPMNTSKWPISQNGLLMSFSDTGVSLTILIAYCFVPASYIIYVINERIRQEKRLQFLAGVGVALYWFSALLWDMITYSITVGITIGITEAFGIHVYTYGENLAALATMLMLFGWATIPLMYLLSRWFTNPRVGYVAAFIINLCIGINTTACIFFLQTPIFNNRPEIVLARKILTKGLLIFPQFCLGDSLVKLAYNQIITDIMNLFHINSYTSPFSPDLLFYHFLTLGIEGAVFFVIHVMVEINLCDGTRKVRRKPDHREDGDVGRERVRVVSGDAEQDLLVLYNLAKLYNRSGLSKTLAVDNLCLGVPRAECFGLLGINGAGKTTSFKMITGEIHPSSGAALLNGKIISEDISNIEQNVGYCPQCDALDDYLTGEEMIYYYSRLRGIYEEDISDICMRVVKKFKLDSHINKRIITYSAGNKRKLSTALALIGDPDLVLLDEPTTGMDPGTRRLVWNNIIDVIKDKRSVILTSHSMEECDALCTRMAIMVNGTFQCMGSSQHLKNKFGSGYTIKLRVGGTITDIKLVIKFMLSKFPGARLKDQHLHMVEFDLPSKSCSLAAMFRRLEREKTTLKIENYSVTQTTLDNVFLHFARKQSDNMRSSLDPEDDVSRVDDIMEKEETSSLSDGDLTSQGDDTLETSTPSSSPPSYCSRSLRSIAPNGYDNPRLSRPSLDAVSQIHVGSDIVIEALSTTSGSHDDDDIDISSLNGSAGESSTDTGNLGGVDSSSSGSANELLHSRR